jgi:two-component system LytT family response regulator
MQLAHGRANLPSVTSVKRLMGEGMLDRVAIKAQGRVLLVRTTEIDWIEAAGNYVTLHVGRASHMIRHTMAEMETRLDPALFIRIHRSRIVNVDRIRELQPLDGGESLVILHDGARLPLSRGYRTRLHTRLGL